MSFDIAKELDEQARREAGLWIDIAGGAQVLMSDPRSNVFQKALQKEEYTYRKRHAIRASKDLKIEERMEVMWRAMFENVVKDWKGIKDKGKNVEFNLENFLRLMTEVWRFREAVMAFAADDETFDSEDDREEVAKNSEKP